MFLEEWRDVPGYDGVYQVSNMGRVRNKYGHIMKSSSCRGYRVLILRKDGKSIGCKVHRLVASVFVPNPDNLPCVNHKNENKADNRAENLEWCSVCYNNTYGTKLARQAAKNRKAVLQYSLDGTFLKRWESSKEAAEFYNCTRENIQSSCNGYTNTARGFIWRYAQTGQTP